MKRGAIFDLDGTLFDTFEHHWEAWRHACQRHGVPLTREQFIWSFGRRNESIIPELWRQAGRPAPAADLVERVGEEKEASFRERLSGRVTPMPGAVELVTRLAAAGWRLAAGSSAPPANVEAFMQGLGSRLPFDALVTGTDVREGKPHPEVFLTAASRLGLPPAQCVVFEDAPPGVEAAHRAGMACVAILGPGRSRTELADAELVVESFHGLEPALLASLQAGAAR